MYLLPTDGGNWLILPYILFAIWFAIYSSVVFPIIGLVICKLDPALMSVGYGFQNAANNIGLGFFPCIFGIINQNNTASAYDISILVLMGFGIVGFVANTIAYYVNIREGDFLDKPNSQFEEQVENFVIERTHLDSIQNDDVDVVEYNFAAKTMDDEIKRRK